MEKENTFMNKLRSYYADKNIKRRIAFVVFAIIILIILLSGPKNITVVQDQSLDAYSFAGQAIPTQGKYIFNQEKLDRELALMQMDPAQFLMIHKRAGRYMHDIREALDDAGIHPDFQYLPMIESALRNNIVSSAGAAGLRQLMPDTARRFGLTVTDTIDERYNPAKATQAAISYLQHLYSIFGDRTLVAAAYNRGENGLRRDFAWQYTNNFFDSLLNNETTRYIYRLAAMKHMYEYANSYFEPTFLGAPYSYPSTKTIFISGPISDLAARATSNGYTYSELRHLNPRIRRNQLPEGKWDVHVFSSRK